MSGAALNERDLINAPLRTRWLYRNGVAPSDRRAEKYYCAVQVFPSALTQIEPASFCNSKITAVVGLPLKTDFARTSMARPVHCWTTGSQCWPESPLKNSAPDRSISSARFWAVALETAARPLGSGGFALREADSPASCCCVATSKLPPGADWDCCTIRGPAEAALRLA